MCHNSGRNIYIITKSTILTIMKMIGIRDIRSVCLVCSLSHVELISLSFFTYVKSIILYYNERSKLGVMLNH